MPARKLVALVLALIGATALIGLAAAPARGADRQGRPWPAERRPPWQGWWSTERPIPTGRSLPGDVLFAFDSAALRPGASGLLASTARWVETTSGRVWVVGFTDSTGTVSYNLALSRRRAISVANALVARGVARPRLVILGLGAADPVASDATASGRSLDRRVEVRTSVPAEPGQPSTDIVAASHEEER